MENKQFKKTFGEVAKNHGFESAFGGWFKESAECIVALELMKSNFGNYYQLNVKIFIQGIFGRKYTKNKDLIKREVGNISRGEPKEYEIFFDLDRPMEDTNRQKGIETLFHDFLVPFAQSVASRDGVKELERIGKIHIPLAVKEELGLIKIQANN